MILFDEYGEYSSWHIQMRYQFASSDFHWRTYICPAESRVIAAHAHAARMHENWGSCVLAKRSSEGCAIRVFVFELGNHGVVQSPPRFGISEIIISQSLVGWQIFWRGVKCQFLRDRGIWVDFFHSRAPPVWNFLRENTTLMRFKFSKAIRIKFYRTIWSLVDSFVSG